MDKVSDTPNQDEVICPACSHQFRAIPENVQSELAAQKEQFRVLEDEMLVMMDERNAAVKELEIYRQRESEIFNTITAVTS